MAGRVTGPYQGYYISATANLNDTPSENAGDHIYVGAVSISRSGPDDPHAFEALVNLGKEDRFATEQAALEQVEAAARAYIDRILAHAATDRSDII